MQLFTKFKSVVFIFLSILFYAQKNDSYVIIKGTTNINTFKCMNNDLHQLLPISLENSPQKNFSETSVNLVVKDFDCKNKVLTSDFRNTLNAEKYPFFNITFLSMDKTSENKYKAYVQVKMMNKTKNYYIDFLLANSKLIGNKILQFSDFGIIPPKKFGGLISVKDNLELTFSLKIKEQLTSNINFH